MNVQQYIILSYYIIKLYLVIFKEEHYFQNIQDIFQHSFNICNLFSYDSILIGINFFYLIRYYCNIFQFLSVKNVSVQTILDL